MSGRSCGYSFKLSFLCWTCASRWLSHQSQPQTYQDCITQWWAHTCPPSITLLGILIDFTWTQIPYQGHQNKEHLKPTWQISSRKSMISLICHLNTQGILIEGIGSIQNWSDSLPFDISCAWIKIRMLQTLTRQDSLGSVKCAPHRIYQTELVNIWLVPIWKIIYNSYFVRLILPSVTQKVPRSQHVKHNYRPCTRHTLYSSLSENLASPFLWWNGTSSVTRGASLPQSRAETQFLL